MGLTSWRFKEWGIQLNKQKSAVLGNTWAQQQDHLFECQVLSSQWLLGGVTTGWDPAQSLMGDRLAVATLTRDRLSRLPVSLAYDGEVDGYLCQPFHGLLPDFLSFDKKLRPILWGNARVSSNWHLIRALVSAVTELPLQGQRFLDLFRGIWNCGAHERLRTRLLSSWTSFLLPCSTGLRRCWLHQLASMGARLVPDVGVEAPWFPTSLGSLTSIRAYKSGCIMLECFGVHIGLDWEYNISSLTLVLVCLG